ncbi:MAG TPA: 23S rRNA (adenine(2503)-C(2))-methyltransferase RlmN [Nitrospirae bacterium]|nr:23S rRNA (adenine(2503)-C(2))-methyltransferase RlmN [Nitrospirota bacterium]
MLDLKSASKLEIEELFKNLKIPLYRVRQLYHWIYEKNASTIDEITEFSKELRKSIAREAYISNIEILRSQVSLDGTEKFLFKLFDGETIEAVLMPEEDRSTLCASTQVGCAMGCLFCKTGSLGLKRNLKANEIVDQILALRRNSRKITNIVLMGMGEPLANINEVLKAINLMTEYLKLSPRRVTLSTVGIIDKLLLLPQMAPPINLAVSINAGDNDTRDFIMPINKKYPLEELVRALRKYPLKRGRRITLEYVLIKGINDHERDAIGLISLIKAIPCKINLIPFNPYKESIFQRPDEVDVLKFQKTLTDRGYSVFIRKSRGSDISAACGQLKGDYT